MDDKIGDSFPRLPSPPQSPISSMEDQTSKQFPARDISLDTQRDTGNNTEVYLNAPKTPGEIEVPETSNSLDGRGDESAILSNTLSKLDVGSTEKIDNVPPITYLPTHCELVTSRSINPERTRIHLAITSEEGSSDHDVKKHELPVKVKPMNQFGKEEVHCFPEIKRIIVNNELNNLRTIFHLRKICFCCISFTMQFHYTFYLARVCQEYPLKLEFYHRFVAIATRKFSIGTHSLTLEVTQTVLRLDI